MEVILGLIILGSVGYYLVKRSKRKDRELDALLESIVQDSKNKKMQSSAEDKEVDHLLAQVKEEYEETMGEEWSEHEKEHNRFDMFNDPYIETAAKANRNNPIIITFVYEKEDEEGNIISSQERAIQPYYRDEDYIEGYCLDYEAKRTFRIDRIVRFTGNSKAIFDALDAS